jgi:hypothetical protein
MRPRAAEDLTLGSALERREGGEGVGGSHSGPGEGRPDTSLSAIHQTHKTPGRMDNGKQPGNGEIKRMKGRGREDNMKKGRR